MTSDELGFDPDVLERALARPEVGDELRALGVKVVPAMGKKYPGVPAEHEARVREILAELAAGQPEPKGEPGRPGLTITKEVLHGLLRRGLERAHSSKKRRERHESVATTQIYLHPSRDDLAAALEALDEGEG